MAIVMSVLFSLVAGVYVMYENQYFWGKEDNSNINTMNNTMNTVGSVTNLSVVIVVILVAVGMLMFVSTFRGF